MGKKTVFIFPDALPPGKEQDKRVGMLQNILQLVCLPINTFENKVKHLNRERQSGNVCRCVGTENSVAAAFARRFQLMVEACCRVKRSETKRVRR
jgi:hypothetical protein